MSSKKSNLNVRIDSELKQKVVEEAESLGMTITEYIEYILNRNDSDSESILSENFTEKLKSIFESNSALNEIIEISHKNLEKNTAILQVIGAGEESPIEDDDSIIIFREHHINKVHELLNVMKGEVISFMQDGDHNQREIETPLEVLEILIDNYHSLLVKK